MVRPEAMMNDSENSITDTLRRKLLGTVNDTLIPVNDELLERYVIGSAAGFEQEIVEIDSTVSPARAAAVEDLRQFASDLNAYDWAGLNERLERVRQRSPDATE